MKQTVRSIYPLFLLYFLFQFTGCIETTPAPEASLIVGSGGYCFVKDGNQVCYEKVGQHVLVAVENGAITAEATDSAVGIPVSSLLQYGNGGTLGLDTFDLSIDNDQLKMSARNSAQSLATDTLFGYVFSAAPRNTEYRTYDSTKTASCFREMLELDGNAIVRRESPVGSTLTISTTSQISRPARLTFFSKKAGIGAEVVLTDDFAPVARPCCTRDYLDCCSNNGGTGNGGELDEPDPSLTGYVVPQDQVCIWEDCEKVVVVNCQQQEIRCFNTLDCPVTIRLLNGYVSISTSPNCAGNNPEICLKNQF